MKIRDWFSRASRKTAQIAGSWPASTLAAGMVVAWIIGGFWVGFNDILYQLLLSNVTTATTFIMVFLIQAQTNRTAKAMQVKLDELIRAAREADKRLIDIDDDTDEKIDGARRKILPQKNAQHDPPSPTSLHEK